VITLIVFAKVKPGAREELLETGRVLFDELAKQPTFLDAWLHASKDDPDLIVVYERWNETKDSFIRDVLPRPFYKPYLAALERIGVSREIHWLEERHAWHAPKE
jgi:quinol monooxygenase YgiN